MLKNFSLENSSFRALGSLFLRACFRSRRYIPTKRGCVRIDSFGSHWQQRRVSACSETKKWQQSKESETQRHRHEAEPECQRKFVVSGGPQGANLRD